MGKVVVLDKDQRRISEILEDVATAEPESVACVYIKDGDVTVVGNWRSRTELMGFLSGALISVWND